MKSGSPAKYTVSQPAHVTEQFLQIVALAELQGCGNVVLDACRYTMDELADDPLHLGESRGSFPHLQLELRMAFAPPVSVQFAIHEQSRQVFIRRFAMRG